MDCGVNLYSIRTLIQDEATYLATVEQLKEMGVKYLQHSGKPYDPELLRKVAKILPIVLTHVPYDRIVDDTENLVNEHLSFGCTQIGLGSMPANPHDEASSFETIDKLEKAACKIESMGAKFFYHHHSFEFFRFSDGRTLYDHLLERAPHVNLTLDTYWLQYGGVDVCDTIRALKGKINCVHLKDYAMAGGPSTWDIKPTFERVGYGNLDFQKIVTACKESGATYFLIEQDNAVTFDDTLGQIRDSVEYIRREL